MYGYMYLRMYTICRVKRSAWQIEGERRSGVCFLGFSFQVSLLSNKRTKIEIPRNRRQNMKRSAALVPVFDRRMERYNPASLDSCSDISILCAHGQEAARFSELPPLRLSLGSWAVRSKHARTKGWGEATVGSNQKKRAGAKKGGPPGGPEIEAAKCY